MGTRIFSVNGALHMAHPPQPSAIRVGGDTQVNLHVYCEQSSRLERLKSCHNELGLRRRKTSSFLNREGLPHGTLVPAVPSSAISGFPQCSSPRRHPELSESGKPDARCDVHPCKLPVDRFGNIYSNLRDNHGTARSGGDAEPTSDADARAPAMSAPNGATAHPRVGTNLSTADSDTATLAAPTPQPSGFVLPGSSKGTNTSGSTPLKQIVIPPEHPFRTLVLCFDGTGDQFDADNSNIVELFTMLKKGDPLKQKVYYQAGIGTYTIPQIATPMVAKISKAIDEMIAWNLDAHIMGGYEFLMENYHEGDRICIFGFSRGSYTARCLAGMIHKVGLLPQGNHQQVPFAYKMYTKPDDKGWEQSNAFKKAFSIDVDIEFVGVWDTVNSVGLIPRRLPFTTSNTIINTFRHAVALDEHRSKFKANLWNRPEAGERLLSVSDKTLAQKAQAAEQAKGQGKSGHGHSWSAAGKTAESWLNIQESDEHSEGKLTSLEEKYGKDRATPTDIEEVWFAGCHCDIGGGSVGNGTRPNLARIPLRWMIRECFKTNSGIMFDVEGLKNIGLNPDSLFPNAAPTRPPALAANTFIQQIPASPPNPIAMVAEASTEAHETEEELERKDALSPIYDQLALHWFWWILELLPLRHRYQRRDNTWGHWFGFNMGEGRKIPLQKENGVKVHRSVKTRMEAQYKDGSRYRPKADLQLQYVKWVD